MIKKLTLLAVGTLGIASLTGCGSSDSVAVDHTVLSTGDSNQVSTGGYWWTYADHANQSSISPKTTYTTAMEAETPPIAHSGKAMHITGSQAPKPNYLEVPDDTYWNTRYTSGTGENVGTACAFQAYPAAGIGFGFKKNNVPFDVTAVSKGITFYMLSQDAGVSMNLALPTALTDVADKSPEGGDPATDADQFSTQCTCRTGEGSKNNCFANYNISLGEIPTTKWSKYCVYWDDLKVPGDSYWPIPDPGYDPTQALKVQFDVSQDMTGTVPFDIWVDDVVFITETNETKQTSDCDYSVALGNLKTNGS